jgi:hypothetical protein
MKKTRHHTQPNEFKPIYCRFRVLTKNNPLSYEALRRDSFVVPTAQMGSLAKMPTYGGDVQPFSSPRDENLKDRLENLPMMIDTDTPVKLSQRTDGIDTFFRPQP